MSQDPNKLIEFSTGVSTEKPLVVAKLHGEEALSTAYSFVLDFVSEDFDIDTGAFVGQDATVRLAQRSDNIQQATSAVFRGIVTRFDFVGTTAKHALYSATVRPRLAKLERGRGSRVFLGKSIRNIVIEILKSAGYADATIDFPASLAATERDYVVQYEETDFAFISRWLEHEGLYYFFDHSGSIEKIRFADSVAAYEPASDTPRVVFSPADKIDVEQGETWFGAEVIQSYAMEQHALPQVVKLNDYNDQTPSVSLSVSATVASSGQGTVYEYNNHYKTQSEGQRLANIRAEEIRCREKLFLGHSNVRVLAPGHKFELAQHKRGDFNKEYVVTRITHHAKQAADTGASKSLSGTYINEFTAIRSDVVFRPARVATWPKIPGVIHAKVDASGDGEYAELDDQGRYKVKLGLDLATTSGGQASKAVRMAQPYAGNEMGMHFPLHKNTEVLLTHFNGNPDRPLISGAVPNPDTKSVVVDTNNSDCIIRSGGGNEIVMEDYGFERRIQLAPGNAMVPPAASFSVGAGGGAFSTIDGMGHMIGSIGMLTNTTVGAMAAMLGSVREVKIFAGYAKLVMLMIALKVAQTLSFKALREARRTNNWIGFWALIFLPIMNTICTMGIAALISNRMNAANMWGLSKAGLTRRVYSAGQNRDFFVRKASGIANTLLELIEPAVFIAQMISTLSFVGAMASAKIRADARAAARKTLPAVSIIRTEAGSIIEVKNSGENIELATSIGHVDIAAGDSVNLHGKNVILDSEAGVCLTGKGGSVVVGPQRVEMHGMEDNAEVQLDKKSASIGYIFNQGADKRNSLHFTAKGAYLDSVKTLIATHNLESSLQISKDFVFLGNHPGTAPVTVGHGGKTISFIGSAIVINNEMAGPVSIISNGKVCLSGMQEVEIKSTKLTLKAGTINLEGGPGGVNVTGMLKANGQDVSVMGPPAPLIPLPAVPVPMAPFHAAVLAQKASLVAAKMAAGMSVKAAALLVDAAEIARQQEEVARQTEQDNMLDAMFESGNFGYQPDSPISQAARRGSSPFFE